MEVFFRIQKFGQRVLLWMSVLGRERVGSERGGRMMINRNKKRRIIINRNKKGRNGWLERRKERRVVFKKFKPHSTNAPLEFTPGEIER